MINNQHGFGSKPSRAILLFFGKDTLRLSPVWWSWQAVLNYSHISIKLQRDRNILVSLEAGRGNCLPYVLLCISAPDGFLRVRRINIKIK